jgi:molecular chaperone DnaK
MSKYPMGIDLGTSTSEIAFFEDSKSHAIPDPHSKTKSPIMPSLVAIDNKGQLLVGDSAASYVNMGQGVREVKRKMGSAEKVLMKNVEYRPEEISSFLLRKLKENAEVRLGCEVNDVVISVPAYFADSARTATRVAGQLAGLNVLRLINEPTAAALAFGVENVDIEAQVVVFDWGGGTLDVTSLEMMEGVLDVHSSFGDPFLGGKDFDETIIKWILNEFQTKHPSARIPEKSMHMIKDFAERLKIQLSDKTSVSDVFPYFGFDRGEPIDLEVDMTRDDLRTMVTPLLDRARICVERALKAGRVNPSCVDHVLLVGGTTYVPCVQELVAELFGRKPKSTVSPDLAVVYGAAVQSALAKGLVSGDNSLILSDGAPIGLGTDVISRVGGHLMQVYDPLIVPNTKIPYSVKRQYSLLHPDQREVEVHIFQSESEKPMPIEMAIDTSISGSITDIPPALYGEPHPLEIEFSYDVDGLCKIRASIPGINKDLHIQFNGSDVRMSDEEIRAAKNRVAELWNAVADRLNSNLQSTNCQQAWESHKLAERSSPYIQKAERLMNNMPDLERNPLRQIVRELKNAMTNNQDSAAEELHAKLVEALFELES